MIIIRLDPSLYTVYDFPRVRCTNETLYPDERPEIINYITRILVIILRLFVSTTVGSFTNYFGIFASLIE